MTQSIHSDLYGPGHMSGLGKVLPDGDDNMRVESRFGFWFY